MCYTVCKPSHYTVLSILITPSSAFKFRYNAFLLESGARSVAAGYNNYNRDVYLYAVSKTHRRENNNKNEYMDTKQKMFKAASA